MDEKEIMNELLKESEDLKQELIRNNEKVDALIDILTELVMGVNGHLTEFGRIQTQVVSSRASEDLSVNWT